MQSPGLELMFRLRVLTGLAVDLIAFGELPLSPGYSLLGGREAVEVLQKVKMSEKHFDWALGRRFQVERVCFCPHFCPHSQRIRE